MRLAVYEPLPVWNPYVSSMYFQPLIQFCHQNGIEVKRISEPTPEAGWTMLCNAYHLTPELVKHFDDNHCPFAAVSCNDSAYLTENIRHFFHHIPLLFTISGVQKVNFSNRSVMNPDMTVSLEPVQFLPEEEWWAYNAMRESGRLLPLPYVPWDRLEDVPIPERKTPKILFRGGNHFWRFVAYLHVLKAGVAHPASGFLTADYFRDDMNPQFRYCQRCRDDWNRGKGNLFSQLDTYQCECPTISLEEPLAWNNRTPRYFYQLATWFYNRYGVIDFNTIEMALNFKRQSAQDHLRAIADAAFFADMKWEFSIHTAQRFWEAASVGTVNLLPDRAMDQEYFPVLNAEEHYLTFSDDCQSFHPNMGYYPQVAANAKETYDHWIRPGNYVTNENLLRHIVTKIAELAS